MIRKCKKCGERKKMTRHSKTGGHQPPFDYICRECHDEIHGIVQGPKVNKKYQPGTPKHKKK